MSLVTIDGKDYELADCHVLQCAAGKDIQLPAEDCIYIDWGDGSPPVVNPSSYTYTADPNGPSLIVKAIFNWKNNVVKVPFDWLEDVLQFGLNRTTGKRNQIYQGARAFAGLEAASLSALSNLDTSNLTSFASMFVNSYNFNQPLNDWDTSNVTAMNNMFQNADRFNQDLNNWDTSKVRNMVSMFRFTDSFNGDITTWDVSSVVSYQEMFRLAISFNQDIGRWNLSSDLDPSRMREMFADAETFNQDLQYWCVTGVTEEPNNFDDGCDAWTLPRPQWGQCPERPPDPEPEDPEIEDDLVYNGSLILEVGTIVGALFEGDAQPQSLMRTVNREVRGSTASVVRAHGPSRVASARVIFNGDVVVDAVHVWAFGAFEDRTPGGE